MWMSPRWTWAVLVAACGGAATGAEPSAPPGFTPLFNGRDLAGWHGERTLAPAKWRNMGPEERARLRAADQAEAVAHWRVDAAGELVNDGAGPYLTTDRDFGDIELLVDWKITPGTDSGVYLRGTPQIQIWDPADASKFRVGADKGSGGLWNNKANRPGKDPLLVADHPTGEWNRFRILQIGSTTTVYLNDKLVVDAAIMENYWDRDRPLEPRGPIQLQTHGGETRWRNIVVRDIPAEEATALLRGTDPEGFEEVFNSRDLEGWSGAVDDYLVEDGALVCRPGAKGVVHTASPYDDFVVRFEFQLPPAGNNGLAIRYPGHGVAAFDGMCEIQVLDSEHPSYAALDPRQRHGSAYGMVPAHRGALRPSGAWNYQEVTVRGSTIRVDLNGVPILDTDLAGVTEFMESKPHPGKDRREGFFGFTAHGDPVRFRRISIRRLDPP